jgi:hypothetical protein
MGRLVENCLNILYNIYKENIMNYFDKAKDDFKAKLRSIFGDDVQKKLNESLDSDKREFNFTGEVDYTVKVENDGEYDEYYVYDNTGKIVEIFTDDMVDQDGILTSGIRKSIRDQYISEEKPEDEAKEELEDESEDVDGSEESEEDTEEVESDEPEETEESDDKLEGEEDEDEDEKEDDTELEGEPVA